MRWEQELENVLFGLGVILGVKTCEGHQREPRGQNNGEKNNNSCETKENIAGFYTEDEPSLERWYYCH